MFYYLVSQLDTFAAFIHLWSEFQKKSSDRLKGAYKGDEDLELIVWTSHLTQEKYIHELPTKEYAIHIWTNGSDVDVSMHNYKDCGKACHKMQF